MPEPHKHDFKPNRIAVCGDFVVIEETCVNGEKCRAISYDVGEFQPW